MRISEHTFESQDVVLDFHEFDHCTFKDCRLTIHGTGIFTLKSCHFVGCTFQFAGPAAMTLQILTSLYHGGFAPVVDGTIENIRGGHHPGDR